MPNPPPTPAPFTFAYIGHRFDPASNHHRLLGRVLTGQIHLGDEILIATPAGLAPARVQTFWDNLYDWLAMPFYHTVGPDTANLFCLCVAGLPPNTTPLCPAHARSPHPSDPS